MIKFAFIGAVALAFGTTPVLASDGSWRVGNDQFHLIYHDIDMSTVSGRASMLKIVERAADKLCEERVLPVDQRECVRAVIAETATKTSNSGLALAVAERGKSFLASK